jgi:hypothetical protein
VHTLRTGWLAVVALGCAPAQVGLECEYGGPLCDAVDVAQDQRPAAKAIDVTRIAFYQGVEIDLMVDGAPVPLDLAPIVAGRDAMIRVFVSPHDDFEPRQITGRLWLHEGDTLLGVTEAAQQIDAESVQEALTTTINFEVSGDQIVSGMQVSIELLEASDDVAARGTEGVHAWPPTDADPAVFEAEPTNGPLRIMVVPIRYNADGSGRMPDTSDEQIEIFRSRFQAMYPVSSVEIEVGDVMDYNQSISPWDAYSWSYLLSALGQQRGALGADNNQYLYGVFNSADTFGEFCGGGCILGLSELAMSSSDIAGRASIGVGFPGAATAETMVHEVGHAHGRQHSPCGGAAGADPGYPYSQAGIGTWGYDAASSSLLDPDTYKDLMGYCEPYWISDYNFDIMAKRVREVNESYQLSNPEAMPTWRAIWDHPGGPLVWGEQRAIMGHPGGIARDVELLDDAGDVIEVVQGWMSPFSHVDGGVVRIPDPGVSVAGVRVSDKVAWRQ